MVEAVEARGGTPAEALNELEERAPSVAEHLRDLDRQVPWEQLSFIVGFISLLIELLK